jgi:glycerophosphoryl diester phosphodiesterase
MLAQVAGKVPLLIEIKNTAANVGPLEAATLKTLAEYEGEFAIQSFCKETVAYLAAHASEIVRGQLSSGSDDWNTPDQPLPHFLAYHHAAIPTPLTTELRAKGIPLLAWTVRTPEQRAGIAGKVDNYIFEYIRP